MTIANTPPYFGRTIFAEDVRREATGQLTIVGALAGGIYIDELPGALNRLAMLIEFQQREDQDVLPVTIRVYAPGNPEPIFEHLHSAESISEARESSAVLDFVTPFPGPAIRRITQVAMFVGLEINEPGLIQVRGFRGDEVLAMGSMLVRAQPQPTVG